MSTPQSPTQIRKRRASSMIALLVMMAAVMAMSVHVAAQAPSEPESNGSEAKGGEKPKAPDAKPEAKAQDKPGPKWDLTFPFRLDGLMYCDVKINDDDRVWNFLIDSGASGSVLAERTADLLNLTTTDAPMQGQGVGKQDISITNNVKFTIGGHAWTCGMAIVTDLSRMVDMSGVYMDGIIGSDWLMQWKTNHFDFVARQVSCEKWPTGQGKRSLATLLGGMFGRGAPAKKAEDKPKQGDSDDSPKATPKPAPKAKPTAPTVTPKHAPLASINESLTLPAVEIPFTMIEIPAIFGGQSTVIASLWFTPMTVNGQEATLLFDTGASALLVLDTGYAKACGVGSSFSFPVHGLGQADATMGVASDFTIAGHSEQGEFPAIVMGLAETFSQLRMFSLMLPRTGMPKGIVGLPFALRYRSMTVDYSKMKLRMIPRTTDDATAIPTPYDPRAEEAQLVATVKQTWESKGGRLGVDGTALKYDSWGDYGLDGGLVVTTVEVDGPAHKAGIKPGDIIAYVDGTTMPDYDAAKHAEAAKQAPPETLPDVTKIPVRGLTPAAFIAAQAGAGTKLTFKVWRKSEASDSPEKPQPADAPAIAGTLTDIVIELGKVTAGVEVPLRFKKKQGD